MSIKEQITCKEIYLVVLSSPQLQGSINDHGSIDLEVLQPEIVDSVINPNIPYQTWTLTTI